MATSPHQLPRTSRARTTFRVVGLVLLLAAAVVGIPALLDLWHAMDSDFAEDPGATLILRLAAAGFLMVFGFGALNAGTIGAQSRYVAGETMPTVKQSATYLSDGRGIMNVGRTDDATAGSAAAATGPFCRACGTRNDEDATFCDSCGGRLA